MTWFTQGMRIQLLKFRKKMILMIFTSLKLNQQLILISLGALTKKSFRIQEALALILQHGMTILIRMKKRTEIVLQTKSATRKPRSVSSLNLEKLKIRVQAQLETSKVKMTV